MPVKVFPGKDVYSGCVNDMGVLGTAAAYGNLLEDLSHPVEQHNSNGFRKVSDGKRSQSRGAHQEIFVKYMAFGQILYCRPYDLKPLHS